MLFGDDWTGFVPDICIPCNDYPEFVRGDRGAGGQRCRWQRPCGCSCNHLNLTWLPVCTETLPVTSTIRVADDKVKPPGTGKEMHIRI